MVLDRSASAHIVKEMIKVLGDARTVKILQVSYKRLKSLVDERGYLTRPQLERISKSTGTSWPRWYVEATASWAKTAADRAFVESARQMWDEIDGRTAPWPVGVAAPSVKPSAHGMKRPAQRTKIAALRHVV